MNAQELKQISDWLIDGARSATSPQQMMAEICERLVAAGLPLWRVGVFVRTLHPDILGINFIWRPGAEVVAGSADHSFADSPEFKNSPLAIVFGEAREVRYRLDDPETKRFPFFDDMRTEGVTDYIALPLLTTSGYTHASSWTTKHRSGFSDEQLNALRSLIPPLTRLLRITNFLHTAALPLHTYLSNRSVDRMLSRLIPH